MAKRRVGNQLSIWLSTIKSQESPQFPCVKVTFDVLLEIFQWGLQFFFRPYLNQRSAHKIMGSQSRKSPHFGKCWDSHLGVLGQNDIWVLVPWPGTEYTIRGKVMVSLKFELWWVLWIHGCMWLVHAPKCSNYALTNLLFGLCRSVWVIELRVNFS
jgi:hypothetical protein